MWASPLANFLITWLGSPSGSNYVRTPSFHAQLKTLPYTIAKPDIFLLHPSGRALPWWTSHLAGIFESAPDLPLGAWSYLILGLGARIKLWGLRSEEQDRSPLRSQWSQSAPEIVSRSAVQLRSCLFKNNACFRTEKTHMVSISGVMQVQYT